MEAEAQFFVDKMTKQEPRIMGDRKPFDYYLSAFLSAGRAVDPQRGARGR
jgi:hypothetical protein